MSKEQIAKQILTDCPYTACMGKQLQAELDDKQLTLDIFKSERDLYKAELDKLRWIPVSEGLPNPKKLKELFVLSGGVARTAIWNGRTWIGYGVSMKFKESITHWMEVPTLPEGETNESD